MYKRQVEEPSYEEYVQIIKHLKDSHAPGGDGLVAELLKNESPDLWKRL